MGSICSDWTVCGCVDCGIRSTYDRDGIDMSYKITELSVSQTKKSLEDAGWTIE